MKLVAWKKACVVAGLAVAAVGMSACSAQPGVAVSVGDVVYTQAQVEEGVRQYAEMMGKRPQADRLVQALPAWAVGIALGQSQGVALDDTQVREQLGVLKESNNIQAIPENPGKVVSDLVRYSYVQQQLAAVSQDSQKAAQLLDTFKDLQAHMPVSVNPRYGSVDMQTGNPIKPLFGDVVAADSLGATAMQQGQ
ncbi:hypothetical protein [Schaalia sp. lx-260]|nr:hypothetical protein [Schaalia sp. lx-260]